MEIKIETHDISTAGLLERRKYGVDAGAAMFALTNLYRNPIDAIVREYTTNMYDAWLALKRENPDAQFQAPEIVLPGPLDSTIVFRDYGIGMSVDTIWNKFMWFGGTTKNQSNDEVGGFGLGCKTANCYNGGSAWTIESRFNGELHSFMCFLAEDGSPDGAHVSSVPTTERNGITITIPIRREDQNRVQEAVQKYLPFFPTDVKVIGATFERPEYVMKGETWGVRAKVNRNYYGHRATHNVVMGNVPYPITANDFADYGIECPQGVNEADWNAFIEFTPIDLYVPIGSVDIVPSRDNLRNTDKTKATMQAAWAVMMGEVMSSFAAELDREKSAWDAIIRYDALTSTSAIGRIVPTIIYRGRELFSQRINLTLGDLRALDPTAKVTIYAIDDSNRGTPSVRDLTDDTNPMWVRPPQRDPYSVDRLMAQNTFVMMNDLGNGAGGVAAARALIHNKLVSKTNHGRARKYGHTIGHLVSIVTKLTADELSDLFGGMPNVLVASVVHGSVAKAPGMKVPIVENIYRWGNAWGARVNIPDDGTPRYYLKLTKEGAKWLYAPSRHTYSQAQTMRDVQASMAMMLPAETPIYGVRPDDVKKLPASWVNLETHALKTITEWLTADAVKVAHFDQKLSEKVTRLANLLVDVVAPRANRHTGIPAEWTLPTLPGPVREFLESYKIGHDVDAEIAVKRVSRMSGLVPGATIIATRESVVKKIKTPNFDNLYKTIVKTHPMLVPLAAAHGDSYNSIFRNKEYTDVTLAYLNN